MKKRDYSKWVMWIAIIAIMMCTIALAVYNVCSNKNFWNASATNCISIIVAVLVAFIFAQKQNNRRKQKELLLDLVLQLRNQVDDTSAYDFKDQTIAEIAMRKRSMSNRVGLILAYKQFFKAGDAEFISERFEEYEELVGDHIGDLEYLEKSKKELLRPLRIMSDRLFGMALELFN